MRHLCEVMKNFSRYRIAQVRLRRIAYTLRKLFSASSDACAKKIGPPKAADFFDDTRALDQ